MMKRLTALLLLASLLFSSALADMDNAKLTEAENAQVWHLNDLDLVIRTMTVPFTGSSSSEDWEIVMMIDYTELAEPGVTAMRLVVSTEGFNMLFADELRITVGKKTYSFRPSTKVNEYDLVYYEDYYVCLGKESLAVITALTKGKGTCKVSLIGDQTVTATLNVPAKEVSALYDAYKKAGGLTQDLSQVDAHWPMVTVK